MDKLGQRVRVRVRIRKGKNRLEIDHDERERSWWFEEMGKMNSKSNSKSNSNEWQILRNTNRKSIQMMRTNKRLHQGSDKPTVQTLQEGGRSKARRQKAEEYRVHQSRMTESRLSQWLNSPIRPIIFDTQLPHLRERWWGPETRWMGISSHQKTVCEGGRKEQRIGWWMGMFDVQGRDAEDFGIRRSISV